MKLLDFNMSAEYCSDWSYLDALREVVQNALDLNIDEAVYSIQDDYIDVNTFEAIIPIECFTMGVSKKSENSIGKYGEGLKIAMMILTRLGAAPILSSSNYTATGKFLPNAITGVETFHLEFIEHEEYQNNTYFTCSVMPFFDIEEIKRKITPFGEFLGKPKLFDIIEDGRGDIYVNGLYVCYDTDLKHSYNFSPNQVTLNRDRNMVDGISNTLARAYVELADAEKIFRLIEDDAKEVNVIEYYLDDTLKTELKQLYYNTYGDSPIVRQGQSMTGISMGHTAYSIYRSCGVRTATPKPDPNTPYQVMLKFAEDNKKYMRRDERKNFEALIKISKTWRVHDVY